MARRVLFLSTVLLFAAACATDAPQMRKETAAVPALPVVLVHGFAGAGNGIMGDYFIGIEDAYTARGVKVLAPNLSPYASSAVRGAQLRDALHAFLDETGADKVHIIGHSQGGLDARYMIAMLDEADHVATLTTISTPHRGSPVADFFDAFPGPVLDLSLFAAAQVVAPFTPLPLDGSDAVRQLTSAEMASFNRAHPDVGVPVYSIAGVTNHHRASAVCDDGERLPTPTRSGTTPWLMPTHLTLNNLGDHPGENDGLVPVASMKFGRFLGCVPSDHVSMVGVGAFPVGGDADAIDPVSFFVDHLEVLAEAERTAAPR